MPNEIDYYILLSVNILGLIFILLFLYEKRHIFKSRKEPSIIIFSGLFISVTSLMVYMYIQPAWQFQDIKSFLLLREWNKSWVLTRTHALGFDLSFAGLVALILTHAQMRRKKGR